MNNKRQFQDGTIPPRNRSGALCRLGASTCGACCYGELVTRASLEQRLKNHQRLFHVNPAGSPSSPPSRWRLLLHELRARRFADLILPLLLYLPWLKHYLRDRLQKYTVCAFLAFEDEGQRRVGCLLHPNRWNGNDVRQDAAYRLLPGFGCGSVDYVCQACDLYEIAPAAEKQRMSNDFQQLDWYDYGELVREQSQVDLNHQRAS